MDCFMECGMDYRLKVCLKGSYTGLQEPQCDNMMSHIINSHMVTDCPQIAIVYLFMLYLDANILNIVHTYSYNVIEKIIMLTLML